MLRINQVNVTVFTPVLLGLGLAALGGTAAARQAASGPGITVGILPFNDVSGNSNLGQLAATLPALLQNSLLQTTTLVPRQIQPGASGAPANGPANGSPPPPAPPPAPNQPMDVPTAAQLGQANSTSLVLVGTLLSGEVNSRQGTLSGASIGGMQLGGSGNRQSAKVTIQLLLVDAGKGTLLGTYRASGQDTETHLDPNATTNYGSINLQSGDFQNSPLGKATQKALTTLTRQLTATLKNFTPTVAALAAPNPAQNQAQQQIQAPAATASPVLVYGDKDLFGTGYPRGVDPTNGAQLGNLGTDQVSNASQSYEYTQKILPGLGDLGGQPEYPGTDQFYVGSGSTPSDDSIVRAPQTLTLNYASLVPAGQKVVGLTLGMAVSGFDSRPTGQTYTAQINGQINARLSRQLNALEIGANLEQFFSIGVDPALLNANNSLALQIDATDPRQWNKPWALDFLTISVATVPVPPAGPAAAGAGGAAPLAPNLAAAAAAPPAGLTLPPDTQIEASYADDHKPSFQPQEQIAFLMLASINQLEQLSCARLLQRPCSLAELVAGVTVQGKTFGLTQDPRQDANYQYALQTLGSNYEIAAVPHQPGLGGFLLDGNGGGGVAEFRFHPAGAATLADPKFAGYGFSGNGFTRQ